MIDIILIALFGLAIFKGLSKGAVGAVFSILGWLVGLAAALKLSAWVAGWMKAQAHLDARWVPFLAFLVVFVGVTILVRMVAGILEKTLELAWLGWANKLIGVVCYLVLYGMGSSIILFYLQQLGWVSPETIANSKFWSWLAPFGPAAIEGLGQLIPWFRNMFDELKDFFGQTAKQLG